MRFLLYLAFQLTGTVGLISWAAADDAPRWMLVVGIYGVWLSLIVLGLGEWPEKAAAPHPKARR